MTTSDPTTLLSGSSGAQQSQSSSTQSQYHSESAPPLSCWLVKYENWPLIAALAIAVTCTLTGLLIGPDDAAYRTGSLWPVGQFQPFYSAILWTIGQHHVILHLCAWTVHFCTAWVLSGVLRRQTTISPAGTTWIAAIWSILPLHFQIMATQEGLKTALAALTMLAALDCAPFDASILTAFSFLIKPANLLLVYFSRSLRSCAIVGTLTALVAMFCSVPLSKQAAWFPGYHAPALIVAAELPSYAIPTMLGIPLPLHNTAPGRPMPALAGVLLAFTAVCIWPCPAMVAIGLILPSALFVAGQGSGAETRYAYLSSVCCALLIYKMGAHFDVSVIGLILIVSATAGINTAAAYRNETTYARAADSGDWVSMGRWACAYHNGGDHYDAALYFARAYALCPWPFLHQNLVNECYLLSKGAP